MTEIKTPKGKDKIYYLPRSAKTKEAKKKVAWLVLGLAMVIIFAAWIFFVRTGLIFPKSSGGGFSQLTNSFKQLFGNIKNDYSDIKANMKEDQEIKQLENKVFPQFTNTNK